MRNGKNGDIFPAFLIFFLLMPCAAGPASGAETAAAEANQWTLAPKAPGGFFGPADDPAGKRSYYLQRKKRHAPLTLFCLKRESGERVELGRDPLLDQVKSKYIVFDSVHKEVLVTGPGAKPEDLGWMVAVAYNPETKKWRRLSFGNVKQHKEHAARLAVLDGLKQFVGRIRACWYRDPAGQGTAAERKDLAARGKALAQRPELASQKQEVKNLLGLVESKKLFDALGAAQKLERQFEEKVEALAPTPPARGKSPLVCDPAHKVLVLFGGDREEYLLNDTWILDLEKYAWRRARPKVAPRPRAGHSLVYLPKSKKIAMWDGYVQTNSAGYRSRQWKPVPDRGVWLYDVASAAWTLLNTGGTPPRYVAFVSDYGAYVHTDLKAGLGDRLLVTVRGSKKNPGDKFWILKSDLSRATEPGKRGVAPNTRLRRTKKFLASYCEVPEPGKPVRPEAIPANTWTLLAAAPRVPYSGQRLKDWSSATWDPDREQILHWGGGHCDGCYSAPTHWSPASGRMQTGYDADEQYGHQGSGGSSVLGRPFVPTHSYKSYAYDPKAKLMLAVKGWQSFLYDPQRMDWLRETVPTPFQGHCYTAILASSPHGVVAWAGVHGYMGGQSRGLWIFERKSGWKNLVPLGKAPGTSVDGAAACYDAKRDRLLMGFNGGYGKRSGGWLWSYDFKTKKIVKLEPKNPSYGTIGFWREWVYVAHCDWALSLDLYKKNPKDKKSPAYNRVYDCARNKWLLLDHGPQTRNVTGVSQGLVYDPKRKLCFSIQRDGKVWALRVDPKTAKIIEAK